MELLPDCLDVYMFVVVVETVKHSQLFGGAEDSKTLQSNRSIEQLHTAHDSPAPPS